MIPHNFSPAAPAVTFYSHRRRHRRRHRRQPPRFPLPRRSFPPSAAEAQPSCRPKGVRFRDQSLAPKKPKSIKRCRELPVEMTAEALIVDSTNRMGPEPSHVPKDLWVVLGLRFPPPLPPPWEGSRSLGVAAEIEFSGSAFNVSPPPSSVPLPNFSLMRKLNCNVEAAAGIDAGATDNLRRLLRLR